MDLAATAGVLNREQIRSGIDDTRPLVSEWIDLEAQLQPNGIDFTLRELSRFDGAGTLGVHNAERMLPGLSPMPFDESGWIDVEPGIYQVVYNEIVDLPNHLMALGRPRSSLCRCGATLHTAVWDAGYRGRSTSLLQVINPRGIRLQRDARIMQMIFLGLGSAANEGYTGVYQGENTDPPLAPGI